MSEVIHGLETHGWYGLKNDASFSTPIYLGDSLLSGWILYDFSTGLRGFSSETSEKDMSQYFYMYFYELYNFQYSLEFC